MIKKLYNILFCLKNKSKRIPYNLTFEYITKNVGGVIWLYFKARDNYRWRGKPKYEEMKELWDNYFKPEIERICKDEYNNEVVQHPRFLMVVCKTIFDTLDGKRR